MRKQRKIDKAIFDVLRTMSEQSEIWGKPIKDSSLSREDLAPLTHTRHKDTFLFKVIKICLSRGYLEKRISSGPRLILTEKGVESFNKEKKRKQRDWIKIISDFLIEYKGFFLLLGLLSSAAILYFRIFHFLPNHTHDHHTHINLSEHNQIKPLK